MKNPPRRLRERETLARLRKQKCFNPAACETPRALQRGCYFIRLSWHKHHSPACQTHASRTPVPPPGRHYKQSLTGIPCQGGPYGNALAQGQAVQLSSARWLSSQCVCARQRFYFSLNTRYHCSTWNTSNKSNYFITCCTCVARSVLCSILVCLRVWKLLSSVAPEGRKLDFQADPLPPLFPRIPSPAGGLP